MLNNCKKKITSSSSEEVKPESEVSIGEPVDGDSSNPGGGAHNSTTKVDGVSISTCGVDCIAASTACLLERGPAAFADDCKGSSSIKFSAVFSWMCSSE